MTADLNALGIALVPTWLRPISVIIENHATNVKLGSPIDEDRDAPAAGRLAAGRLILSSACGVVPRNGGIMAVNMQPFGRGSSGVGPWADPEQMYEVAALVRLLAVIWTVPRVRKVSYATRATGIDVWVFMTEDNYEDEALISRAEREYLNANPPHGFQLHVVPGTDISPDMLPPATVLLER
jgi:hypothetical protein